MGNVILLCQVEQKNALMSPKKMSVIVKEQNRGDVGNMDWFSCMIITHVIGVGCVAYWYYHRKKLSTRFTDKKLKIKDNPMRHDEVHNCCECGHPVYGRYICDVCEREAAYKRIGQVPPGKKDERPVYYYIGTPYDNRFGPGNNL